MDFTLSDDQIAFQDMAQRFALDRLAPNAVDWYRRKHFPTNVLQEAGALGLGALYTRVDVGGSALGRLDCVLVFEALARGCPAIAAYISIHNMSAWMIDSYGTEARRQRWCPALASIVDLASYCQTEPDAGSDAASLATRADRDGDDWVLNHLGCRVQCGLDRDGAQWRAGSQKHFRHPGAT